jgi:hypothetical protein
MAGGVATSGFAVVEYSLGGVLVSEAAFPAQPLIENGRIFAEIQGSVNTGIAIANPHAESVDFDFYFTDEWGAKIHTGKTTLAANQELTAFLTESPFRPPSYVKVSDTRSFTFTASRPIAFTAMRGLINERSEFLMSTLPIAALGPLDRTSLAFPYYVDGGGWSSGIVLVNPTDTTISGNLDFFTQTNTGDPGYSIVIAGQPTESARYNIPRNSAVMIQTILPRSEFLTGWVRVRPAAGTSAPVGSMVFSREQNRVTVSQSAVALSTEGTEFRVYVESSGSFRMRETSSVQSGLAISNSAETPALVNLELLGLDGASTGLFSQISIPPLGHARLFLDQIPGFQGLQAPFKGFVRVTGTSVAVVELKARYNERSEFVLASMPAVPESALMMSGHPYHYFAHGAGYTTSFIPFTPPPPPVDSSVQ